MKCLHFRIEWEDHWSVADKPAKTGAGEQLLGQNVIKGKCKRCKAEFYDNGFNP